MLQEFSTLICALGALVERTVHATLLLSVPCEAGYAVPLRLCALIAQQGRNQAVHRFDDNKMAGANVDRLEDSGRMCALELRSSLMSPMYFKAFGIDASTGFNWLCLSGFRSVVFVGDGRPARAVTRWLHRVARGVVRRRSTRWTAVFGFTFFVFVGGA